MGKMEEWLYAFKSLKVIVRSNEDEPFKVGELKRFERIHSTLVPIVEVDGTEWGCMGVMVPWTQELADFLTFLEPARQWEIMRDISMSIQMQRREVRAA